MYSFFYMANSYDIRQEILLTLDKRLNVHPLVLIDIRYGSSLLDASLHIQISAYLAEIN